MTDFRHQAAILVGGLGTRLASLVAQRPKPMLDIAGKPFLDRLLAWLARQGCREVVLLCGYRAEVVRDHYAGGEHAGMTVTARVETAPRGTAGAMMDALEQLNDEFLLLNGDSWFGIDLARLALPAPADDWAMVMAAARLSETARFGRLELAPDGRVIDFREKGQQGPGIINAGIYRVRRDALADFAGTRSLETEVLPVLAARRQLWAVTDDAPFIDIGIPEELERAREQATKLFGKDF